MPVNDETHPVMMDDNDNPITFGMDPVSGAHYHKHIDECGQTYDKNCRDTKNCPIWVMWDEEQDAEAEAEHEAEQQRRQDDREVWLDTAAYGFAWES